MPGQSSRVQARSKGGSHLTCEGDLRAIQLVGSDERVAATVAADFAVFERSKGHLPIPLRDSLGGVITVDSATPYSGRQTCGAIGCHDVDYIANGLKFQQGRTDTTGNIIVQDDYFEDGRWWIRGGGRYGLAMPVGSATILAAKESARESDINLTTFDWVGDCGSCHVGGGPGEFDRAGKLLYNQVTGEFGFELLDKTWDDVEFDGDYSSMDFFGNLSQARWDITGLEEPDCMYCHTSDPTWGYAADNRNAWRTATLAGMTALVDDYGDPVPAYAAAGAASQGWFSNMETNGAGAATVLQIDYSVGVGAGTLMANLDDTLALGASSVDRPPRDKVCWGCHSAAGVIRGQVWFDERVIHYAGLNNLTDEDPSNDIPPERSTSCNYCHPGNLEHNFAKGNNPITSWRNELDWVNFRSCRECHLTEFPNGEPNPDKHPDAPDVPGTGEVEVHLVGFYDEDEGGPMRELSCQACHIPYPLLSPGWGVLDNSASGIPSIYPTSQFYSADPLDPSGEDKSRWWVGLVSRGAVPLRLLGRMGSE